MTLQISLKKLLVLGVLALSMTEAGFAREIHKPKSAHDKAKALHEKVKAAHEKTGSSSSSSSSASSSCPSKEGVCHFTVYEYAGAAHEMPSPESIQQRTLDGFGNCIVCDVTAGCACSGECTGGCDVGGCGDCCTDCFGSRLRSGIGNQLPFGNPIKNDVGCQIGYDSGNCIRTFNLNQSTKFRKVRNADGDLVCPPGEQVDPSCEGPDCECFGAMECAWTTVFGNGSITVAGVFNSDSGQPSVFAITGGTGDYVGVEGSLTLEVDPIRTPPGFCGCGQPSLNDPNCTVYQETFRFTNGDFPEPAGFNCGEEV